MAAPLLPARPHTTQPTAALQQRICWTRFAADEPGFRAAVAEPSRADEVLISTLKTALSLVDVRVLDHLIVAGNDVMSFAERELL